MTTDEILLLDHAVALLSVVAWFAAGVAVALRRHRVGLALLGVAALVTAARVATVVLLADRGWWFVQEKVLLGLPLLGVSAVAAVLVAGRPLIRAWSATDKTLPAAPVVAVLTAAYAALAGLVVTLLVGYPLTWGTALIAIAVVSLAALLTGRTLAPDVGADADVAAHPAPADRARFSRRQVFSVAGGIAVVGAGATGLGLSFGSAAPLSTGGGGGRRAASTVSVTDLRGATRPAPGGTTHRHVLTARTGTVTLPTGRQIEAWTYSGELPGPAITATAGDLVEVTLRNDDIEDGVTLHWHGYDVACGEDGAPGATQEAVAPGGEFVYRFRADQLGTYWFHTHQASHIGVRKGLYGTLVVRPRGQQVEGVDLTLPLHTFDGTLVIGDRDGRTEQITQVGAPVRLRLINTDSDPRWCALAGTPFRVAAVDGRDLHQPSEVSRVGLRLPAGGRYDVVFAMPESPVVLVVDGDRDGGVVLRPEGGEKVDADGGVDLEDPDGWPELDLLHYGEQLAAPFDADDADRHFTMVLDRGVAMVDGRPAYAHTVNGLGHPSIPDQLVAEGDLVRFTVVNRSLDTHPWHLHGHPVLVLSRDDTPSSGSPLWVDTFDVRPGEVWEVAFEATNPGVWMNHCHNLPHAHEGMMLRLVYDGVTSPFTGHDH